MSGRRDGKGEKTSESLSARTVRYIHTILGAALGAAVPDRGLLPVHTGTEDDAGRQSSSAPIVQLAASARKTGEGQGGC